MVCRSLGMRGSLELGGGADLNIIIIIIIINIMVLYWRVDQDHQEVGFGPMLALLTSPCPSFPRPKSAVPESEAQDSLPSHAANH